MNAQFFLQLYQQKHYGKIVEVYESYQSNLVNDNFVTSLYLKSIRQLGDLASAKAGFDNLYKKAGHLKYVINDYGNVLIAAEDYKSAISVFLDGIKKLGSHYELVFNLARAYQRDGQFNQAFQYFSIASQINPSSLDAHLGRAESLAGLGNLNDSYELYKKLAQQVPNNVRLLNNFSHLCRRIQLFDEALFLAQKLVSLAPSNPQFLRNLAATFAASNRPADALVVYQNALALEPLNRDIHLELAHWLWFCGEEEPFRFIQAQIAATPEQQDLWLGLVRLLIKCDDLETAMLYLDKFLSRKPNHFIALQLLSNIKREKGHFEEALSLSRLVLNQSDIPHNVAALNEHAYNLLASGDFKEAFKFAKMLVNREPNEQGWWNLYATCLRCLADYDNYTALCDYSKFVNITDCALDEVNLTELKNYVLKQHSGKRHPIGQSLMDGSQTLEDLFDVEAKPVEVLRRFILNQVTEHVNALNYKFKHPFLGRIPEVNEFKFTGSWSVKLNPTGFHKPHFHSAGWISGVFYVDVPEAIKSGGEGWIEFGRPNIPGLYVEPELVVKPQNGRLVLFPSYMWHSTRPFSGRNMRLTVAFDLIPATECL